MYVYYKLRYLSMYIQTRAIKSEVRWGGLVNPNGLLFITGAVRHLQTNKKGGESSNEYSAYLERS